MEKAFKEFLSKKIVSNVILYNKKIITFKQEVEEIFSVLRDYKEELYEDLKANNVLEENDWIEWFLADYRVALSNTLFIVWISFVWLIF